LDRSIIPESRRSSSERKENFGAPKTMDKFEEIGRRIDDELNRLRRYIDEQVAPETERRGADFLREISAKLNEFAAKLEARNAARRSAQPPPPPTTPL
jgi:hypothetical protein